MSTAIVACCTLNKYGELAFQLSATRFRLAQILWYTLAVLEAILIVASRQHYTVDVIVSIYTTPLVWWLYECVVPEDVDRQVEAQASAGKRPSVVESALLLVVVWACVPAGVAIFMMGSV